MDNGYHPIPSNQNQRGSKPESLRVHPISLHTSNTSKLPTELALEPHRAAVARLCGIETSTAGLKVMGCRAPRSAVPDEPKGPTRTDQPKIEKNTLQPPHPTKNPMKSIESPKCLISCMKDCLTETADQEKLWISLRLHVFLQLASPRELTNA